MPTDTDTTQVLAAHESASAGDTDIDDGTYVPPMLLIVFGLPIFLTLIWFFLRFTAPDRFGRVDRRVLDAADPEIDPPSEPPEDDADDPDDGPRSA